LPNDTVALALSGGGIRSATFCLGVLQTLSRQRLLRKIDFLSTVSGGGYCGSFLGALINRRTPHGTTGIDAAEARLADPRSPIVNWLRQNGRYLSPNGAGDTWLAFAVMLRNWIAVQVVLATMVLAAIAAVVALRIVVQDYSGAGGDHVILWSPLWYLSLALFVVLTLPLGVGYWLTPQFDPKTGKPISYVVLIRALAVLVLLFVAFEMTWRYDNVAPADKVFWLRLVLAACLLLLAASITVMAAVWLYSMLTAHRQRPDRRIRNRLSSLLAQMFKFTCAAAAVALIDSLGETLYTAVRDGMGQFPQIAGLLGAGGAATAVRPLITFAQRTNGKGRIWLPWGVIAGAVAVLIGTAVLVVLSASVYAIADKALLMPWEADPTSRLWSALTVMGAALVLSYAMGATLRFANDSSQQALYSARLARAYLGASNPAREAEEGHDVTEPIPGDDSSLCEYAPFAHGGPLHLINLTLNETVSGESQIEYRDRKGLAMAIGPAGMSASVKHHALWGTEKGKLSTKLIEPIPLKQGAYQIFPNPGAGSAPRSVESLSLSTWIAISGAAAGPGLGALTSLGFSMLLTFFNIRMGYWWDSHIAPGSRGRHGSALTPARCVGRMIAWLLPVQTYLFYELLARFYGPNRRHWYLSDGGHFENLACYELIRRRVPFIVVCDCGQDNLFQFSDVAGLVRKARTDFNAEIRFLARHELAALHVSASICHYFGVPDDFTPFISDDSPPAANDNPRPCAMLARVDYDGQSHGPGEKPGSVILFLKPSIVGDEPEDILNYQKANVTFPHETTGDQYFNEAQWEAYRKLGEVIANRLFADGKAGSSWLPRDFCWPAAPHA
jgi:hypothetical protein